MHARTQGPGGAFPVLLLHGWLADAHVWDAVARDLARDFRVVTPDLRGAGRSRAAAGPFRLERFAADCSDLVRAIALDPALVVGHSMGAAIAERFAIDDPAAVEALALVNPTPPSGVRFPPHLTAMFHALPGAPERILAWLRRLTVEPLGTETERDLLRAALAIEPGAAREAFEAWSGADFGAEAATIEQPVFVLAGEADRALPPGLLAREIVAPLARARLEVVAGAGHYLPLERPELIVERVRTLIDSL